MNQPRGSIWLSDTLNEAHLDTTVACCARSAGRSLFPPWKEFPGLVARCWLTGVDSCGIFGSFCLGKGVEPWEFSTILGVSSVSSNDPPISSIVWRNHAKAMRLVCWLYFAALPLIRAVFWMRYSPDQQELENSYERLVFILWATVALCQRSIPYDHMQHIHTFDADSMQDQFEEFTSSIWELTSSYTKTMVSWCFLTVLH